MTKELQDLVWSILPKEFKEEVKEKYHIWTAATITKFETEIIIYEYLFGKHNLTSDAEGEEMLTVSRKQVQEIYRDADNLRKDPAIPSHAAYWNAEVELLQDLFGSKCLPDEKLSQNPPENCDTEKHISTDCDKAAEPKFKVGDVVRIKPNAADYHQGYQNGYVWLPERNKYVGKVFSIINVWPSGTIVLNMSDNVYWEAIDLEPYTEPTEKNPKESDETFAFNEPTTTKSDDFDHIIRDGFRNHNRLHIAAMAMQGLLANPLWMKEKQFYAHPISEDNPDKAAAILIKDIAEDAMEFADALIAECKQTDN